MKISRGAGEPPEALSLQELCHFCRTDEGWMLELVQEGALEPQGQSIRDWRFFGASIARARKASRLRRDLGVNAAGAAMVLELLQERDRMMRRLARYETP